MIEHLLRFTLPAAYALLPPQMNAPAASAMLLAIALQESGATYRRQRGGGGGRSFWQFERGDARKPGGVYGVLTHPASRAHLISALTALQYRPVSPPADAVRICYAAIEHNDTLAAVCARVLLWTLPVPLPGHEDRVMAWGQYTAAWRPGKPRPETWNDHFATAWALVAGGETHGQ